MLPSGLGLRLLRYVPFAALTTARYDLPDEDDPDKRLLIGFNIAGNPIVKIVMEEFMKEMTDEEDDALDEYYTKNPPRVDPSKNGGFAKNHTEWLLLTYSRFSIGF